MSPRLDGSSAVRIRTAFWTPCPDSPRILVHVHFDGTIPPIIGYWTMN